MVQDSHLGAMASGFIPLLQFYGFASHRGIICVPSIQLRRFCLLMGIRGFFLACVHIKGGLLEKIF